MLVKRRDSHDTFIHVLQGCVTGTRAMGLLRDTHNCRLRMRRECRERFPHHRFQRKLLVSRHVRHARAVVHVGIVCPRLGKTFPAFPAHAHPQFYVSGKRPIDDKVRWLHILSFHLWLTKKCQTFVIRYSLERHLFFVEICTLYNVAQKDKLMNRLSQSVYAHHKFLIHTWNKSYSLPLPVIYVHETTKVHGGWRIAWNHMSMFAKPIIHIKATSHQIRCYIRWFAICVLTHIHSQGVHDGSAEEDSLSSSCQGLEDICSRTYASIHVDLATTCDCFDNVREYINLKWPVSIIVNVYVLIYADLHACMWAHFVSHSIMYIYEFGCALKTCVKSVLVIKMVSRNISHGANGILFLANIAIWCTYRDFTDKFHLAWMTAISPL